MTWAAVGRSQIDGYIMSIRNEGDDYLRAMRPWRLVSPRYGRTGGVPVVRESAIDLILGLAGALGVALLVLACVKVFG
jgi:hypothetical protein